MYRASSRSMVLSVVVLCIVVLAAFSVSFMLQSCSDSGGSGSGGLQANAGQDMTVFSGKKVWLDGTKSHPEPNLLTYYWKIIRKPHGSQAALDDPNSSRPALHPDKPGEFVLNLHVTLGAESSSDTVTITTQYPYAAFLDFDSWVQGANTGKASDYGIKLGFLSPNNDPPAPVTYATDFTGTEAGNEPYGFQVWIIDRSTGLPTSTQPVSYPMFSKTDADAMATALQSITDAYLVVISALMRPTPPGKSLKSIDSDNKLVPAMQALGASGYLDNLGATSNDTESYSLVGIGGIGKGFGQEVYGAHHGNAQVSISGQLILDTTQNYIFSYGYVPFETRTADNSMTVAGVSYPLPEALPANSGGFHVLVLQRDTLTPVLHKLYLINNNGTADADAMQSMGNDLYGYALSSDYQYGNPYLVFVSSVGSLPNIMESFNNDKNDADMAERALTLLGGTPGVFPALSTTDTYGLVGHGPGNGWPNGNGVVPATQESYMGNFVWVVDPNYPIESLEDSSVLHPATATYPASVADLRGLLRKDLLGWYTPSIGEGGGSVSGIDYSLITTAFQPPTAWQGPDNAYEQEVYADLSMALQNDLEDVVPTDIRQSYWRTDIAWSDRYSDLDGGQLSTCSDLQAYLENMGQADPDLDCTDQNVLNAFAAMRGYLLTEIEYVEDLSTWNEDVWQLLQLINAEENGQFLPDYENAMQLAQLSSDDKGKKIATRVLGFVQNVLAVASYAIPLIVAEPESAPARMIPQKVSGSTVGGAVGLVSSLIGLATDCVPQKSASNPVPGEVQAEASDLWDQIQENYINSVEVLNQAYTFLTTDWGKLNQIHQIYDSLYDPKDQATVIQNLEPGINASFYQFLLPVVYKAEAMPYTVCAQDDNGNDNPCYFYVCTGKEDDKPVYTENCKGKITRPTDSYVMIKNMLWNTDNCGANDDNRTTCYYTVWKSNSDNSDDYYSDKDIQLFQPPSPGTYSNGVYSGGLGVSKYTFTSRWPFNYEYPSGKSDTDTYHWGSGCNCSPWTHPCEN